MLNRNPESLWNPAFPINVTPEEYEKQVVSWMKSSGDPLMQFKVEHLEHLTGNAGDYEFDAVATFTVLKGAQITILVECKRYSRPVERDHILTLWAKLQDVNAQKAMMFATCGFQKGALEFAGSKGIATIIFSDNNFKYETRSLIASPSKPPMLQLKKFIGIVTSYQNKEFGCVIIHDNNTEPLTKWLLTS